MAKEINPFIVSGKINPDYFCDRVTESAKVIKSITNGNNLVIMSPRRMGKTGLIQFCYEKPEIKENYYTFYIDILHTSSLREFTYVLGKEIFESLKTKSRKMVELFVATIKSISGKFSFDPLTNLPSFSIELGDMDQPQYTLAEIFSYLDKADKPCIVAIDEFQQIAKYKEKNVEALLRSHIQMQSNSNFIYAGSERSMMQEMFVSSARPFYRSADTLELDAIDLKIYTQFVVKNFEERERKIDVLDVERVYAMFKGHTYYIQKAFNEAYALTPKGEVCTSEMVDSAIDEMIHSNETLFKEILSNIPEAQKMVLYAIAKEEESSQITSAQFIKRHSLSSSSSVQSAVRILLEKEILTVINKTYSISDKLFSMWIKTIYG